MRLEELYRLKGKVAIVTGGGRGIGQAICARFVEAGAHVAVLDVNEADAGQTAAQLREAGGSAEAVVVDVRDAQAVQNAVDTIAARAGRLDVVVNNAAIFPMR